MVRDVSSFELRKRRFAALGEVGIKITVGHLLEGVVRVAGDPLGRGTVEG